MEVAAVAAVAAAVAEAAPAEAVCPLSYDKSSELEEWKVLH